MKPFFYAIAMILFISGVAWTSKFIRQNSEDEVLREHLIKEEGFERYPYYDERHFLTIGIGHNLDAQELPDVAINALYDYDIAACRRDLLKHAPVYSKLNYARKAVLVDIRFNTGLSGLLKFENMFAMLEKEDYAGAADAILDSEIATERKERLAKIMRTGKIN